MVKSSKQKILVVDDEPLNQVIMTEMLSDDYDLVCVDNGISCLQHIAKNSPDLVLLDVHMQDMDGLEVCRTLRAQQQYQLLPIIFVSSLASEKEKQAGYEAGAHEYVTKPFVEAELLDAIKKLLQT